MSKVGLQVQRRSIFEFLFVCVNGILAACASTLPDKQTRPKDLDYIMITEPPPFRQKSWWDCGLACSASAASVVLGQPQELLYKQLQAHVPLTSVWTVELALALQAVGVPRPVFYTRVLGVNAAHAELAFYAPLLSTERPRIAALFEVARSRGLVMAERSLSLDHICDHLSRRACMYVALVDLRRITCKRCLIAAGAFQFVFAGHYVLLVSYDYATDQIIYMDPNVSHSAHATSGPYCVMAAADIEAARLVKGTDEDIIEIPLAVRGK